MAPPRSTRAQAAILEATRALLARHGYPGLTMEAIAASAGVGKQTIYRWWPTKGRVVLDALASDAQVAAPLPDTGDLAKDLRLVLRAIVAELRDAKTDALYRALIVEMQSDAELAARVVTQMLAPQAAATVARLQAARRAGQVRRGVDLEAAVELLYGAVFRRWLLRTGPFDRAFADEVTAQLIASLRPAARAARRTVRAKR